MPPTPQLLHQSVAIDAGGGFHAPILGSCAVHWPDEAACAAFAQSLVRHVELRNATIELSGPLGAGKTTFVRHLLHALGVAGRIKSPTYAVVEPYEVPGLAIWHFDFYRFSDPREWHDAGFRDTFASPGLKLAEWPEHARAWLPLPDLRVVITPLDQQERAVMLQACSARGLALMA